MGQQVVSAMSADWMLEDVGTKRNRCQHLYFCTSKACQYLYFFVRAMRAKWMLEDVGTKCNRCQHVGLCPFVLQES